MALRHPTPIFKGFTFLLKDRIAKLSLYIISYQIVIKIKLKVPDLFLISCITELIVIWQINIIFGEEYFFYWLLACWQDVVARKSWCIKMLRIWKWENWGLGLLP